MIYRISVDGEKMTVEVGLGEVSRGADHDARKKIIDYFLDVEGANSVVIESDPVLNRKSKFGMKDFLYKGAQ